MSNNKNVILAITIALAGAMAMVSCSHSSSPQASPQISFSAEIVPIFTSYCALNGSCHMGANSTNQETNFDADSAYYTIGQKSLVNLSNPSASLLYAEVAEHQMPLSPYSPLSSADQQLILEWIEQGAKDN